MSSARHLRLLKSDTLRCRATASRMRIPLLELSEAGAIKSIGTNTFVNTMWVDMFNGALSAGGAGFRWKRGGLGAGRETKRSFSNILGRFCARWYLTRHEGLLGLESIEGENDILPNVRVARRKNPKTGKKVDLPDWLGWTRDGLVLAEAKGSHDGSDWRNWRGPKPSRRPGCLRSAMRQLMYARLEVDGRPVQSKKWAVASRWATEADPNRNPYIYAIDPEQPGGELSADRFNAIVKGLESRSSARLLTGMRVIDPEIGLEQPDWGNPGLVAYELERAKAEPVVTKLAGDRVVEGYQAAFGFFGAFPIRTESDQRKLKSISDAGLPVLLIGVSPDRMKEAWSPIDSKRTAEEELGRTEDRGITMVRTMPGTPMF